MFGFAANFVLLPYYTFNYLVSSSGEGSRSPLADSSLLVLFVLIHYRKCVLVDDFISNKSDNRNSNTHVRENSYFSENPYCKALENARDIECKILSCFGKLALYLFCQYTPLFKFIFCCSWSCRYWRKCTQRTTSQIAFRLFVWHPWNVSFNYWWYCIIRTAIKLDT